MAGEFIGSLEKIMMDCYNKINPAYWECHNRKWGRVISMYLASDFRTIARKALRGFWALTIGVTLLAVLLGGGVDYLSGSASGNRMNYRRQNSSEYDVYIEQPGFSMSLSSPSFFTSPAVVRASAAVLPIVTVLALIQLLIGGAVELGLKRYNLDLLTHENPPAFATLFSRFCIWGRAFGLRFMTSLLIFLWTLLLIIPGIVASYRYALAPYLMAENPDMGVMEAIARSKELMKGNKWRLFCLELSFIGWHLLCMLTLGIGYLWLAPYRNAAETAFYLETTARTEAMPRPEDAE